MRRAMASAGSWLRHSRGQVCPVKKKPWSQEQCGGLAVQQLTSVRACCSVRWCTHDLTMSSDGWTTIESEPGVFHQLISEFGVKGVQARMGWDAFCDGVYDLPACIFACSAQIWAMHCMAPSPQ